MTSQKIKVLVFPCGSEIGLEINAALRHSRLLELWGASSVSSNHGKYVYENYVESFPYIDAPGFLPALRAFIEAKKINFIFSAHDSVVLELAHRQSEIPCKVITSPFATCAIARSKRKTNELLSKHGIRVPKIFEPCEPHLRFPVFLKPDVGQGSKGTFKVTSYEEIQFYRLKDPSLLVLEYLPGKEFTVDCFTDRHGALLFVGARERLRIQNGISVHTKPVSNSSFNNLASQLNKILTFRGAWFFQVKEDEQNELAVLELAPRIAGSMGLYRSLGVNFPLLSIFDAMGQDLKILCNSSEVEMDRALASRFRTNLNYNHIYIDLDDCIVFGEKVNTAVIAFLYHCLNRGKRLHLLTRHKGNVQETLTQFRLNGLFDTVVHLQQADSKANHITCRPCIFIDDSFSERADVQNTLGIPVFAPDAVESLMDVDR